MQQADTHSAQTAVEAHNVIINGGVSLDHDLDSARVLIGQAHGVLAAITALIGETKNGIVNLDLMHSALCGAETLLEQGLRDFMVGYKALLIDVRKH